MKKLVFFTPSLNIGGIERVFMTYANSLTTKFYVEYVVCHKSGDLKQCLNENIHCEILGTRLRTSLFKLTRYLIKSKPDYLITGGDISNATAIIANKLAGNYTKIIISQHNYLDVEQTGFLSKFIYTYIYPKAYKIIAVSNDIASFIKNFLKDHSKLVTVYNPINISLINQLALKAEENNSFSDYILYVGRLSEVKNLHFLIQSFAKFKKVKPEFRLVFVGGGNMKDSLMELAKSLQLEDSIVFVGIITNPFYLIKNAKLVVLPSFSEALPTIILESFALGKTMVATPTKGAVDLLKNGEYGYLTQSFNDTEEFSNTMLLALNVNKQSEILIRYAGNFDVPSKIKEITDIIEM